MTTQRQYIALGGGIDTETAVLAVAPGFVREAWNFEQAVDGGYKRIAGYERYDGRPAPSEAQYATLPVTLTGSLAVGASVTGSATGATGVVLRTRTGEIDVYLANGTDFETGEALVVAGTPVGSISGFVQTGIDPEVQADAADIRRALIQAVPGEGPIRGVVKYGGSVFAFRDAATSKRMYKATPAGWVLVATPSLQKGGNLECVPYNFGDGVKLYGCDGVNKAFCFDGATYTEITTGMTDDRPQHIAAHQNHLFLAFGHSVQHSSIGDPMTYSPVLGALEINVGAPVTNMVPQPGQQGAGAMAIATESSLFILYGTSSANWSLVTLQSEMGALPGSMQNIGVAFMLNPMGVTILGQSQEYGNFAHSVISNRANSWLRRYGQTLTGTTLHRRKNQYRLFFGNRGLFVTVQGRKVMGIMPVDLQTSVSCCYTSPDDEFFFGDENGFVFQGERGASFDGQPIISLLIFPFNSAKSVRQRKRYRRLLVEVDADSPVEMTANFTLSYGDFDVMGASGVLNQQGFSLATWDSAAWDVDVWDGGLSPIARIELDGTGENLGLTLGHVGRALNAFTLRSFILEFSARRGER